ncbi:hypothetical protein LIER_20856 [Lithospermum erythrorhizon]|uniref:Bifunctional inhibitor/plant lipid transfer protein/seed storage helical domain-containing protein n=1 Tax=Lithospermum erythrorhizon TaxID=34254 RepID=A0AAV3QR14_LITER
MALQSSIFYSLAISLISISGVYGQLNAPCTASMLTSFNPCMSFLTSGSNITQPPPECCDALRSLMSNGTNCMCQIATGTIPFRIPINRTTAVSLPRACNMPGGVTLQCKSKTFISRYDSVRD